MENNKTIFISSFFGLIARNILDTDVLKILLGHNNLKIVILTSSNKKESYQERFGNERVIIEGFDFKKKSKIDNIFSPLFLNALDTNSRHICRFSEAKQGGRWVVFIFWTFIAKISNIKIFRFFLRWLDCKLSNKDLFRDCFEKYSPDIVFSTDIFEPHDVALMRESKHRKILTLGMIRSWDNITTHGLNRIVPDKLIVNTEQIKQEAIKYNDIKEENVFISGIPHYDKYIKERKISKNDLFKELKLDPNKKTIFFAPTPNIFSGDNPVNSKIIESLLNLDVQLILRLYFVGDVDLGGFKAVPNKLTIDSPPSSKDSLNADLRINDRLPDLLYYSDVVVAFASTLAIDAIVFDKPVVFIGFDAKKGYPYWRSLRRFYDFDHQKLILDTGGVRLAKSMDDLVFQVKKYLENPALDEENRKKVISDKCWKLDGLSSKRLAGFILSNI